jgi:hypothetical protein
MLEEFLCSHEVDIVLLQEVTDRHINCVRRYIGTEMSGTDILVKDGINLTDLKHLPSRRGRGTNFQGHIIKMSLYYEKQEGTSQTYSNTDLPIKKNRTIRRTGQTYDRDKPLLRRKKVHGKVSSLSYVCPVRSILRFSRIGRSVFELVCDVA